MVSLYSVKTYKHPPKFMHSLKINHCKGFKHPI